MGNTSAHLLVFILTVNLLVSWGTAIASPRGDRVQSDDGTVSILVPPEWNVKSKTELPEEVKMAIFSPFETSSDLFSELIFVNADILQSGHTINDYIKLTLIGTTVLDTQVTIDGRAARRIVSKMKMQGQEAMLISYTVKINNIAYTINAITLQSSYDRWKKTLNEIILTVQFHGASGQ